VAKTSAIGPKLLRLQDRAGEVPADLFKGITPIACSGRSGRPLIARARRVGSVNLEEAACAACLSEVSESWNAAANWRRIGFSSLDGTVCTAVVRSDRALQAPMKASILNAGGCPRRNLRADPGAPANPGRLSRRSGCRGHRLHASLTAVLILSRNRVPGSQDYAWRSFKTRSVKNL